MTGVKIINFHNNPLRFILILQMGKLREVKYSAQSHTVSGNTEFLVLAYLTTGLFSLLSLCDTDRGNRESGGPEQMHAYPVTYFTQGAGCMKRSIGK